MTTNTNSTVQSLPSNYRVALIDAILWQIGGEGWEGRQIDPAIGVSEGLTIDETVAVWHPFYGWAVDVTWSWQTEETVQIWADLIDPDGRAFDFTYRGE